MLNVVHSYVTNKIIPLFKSKRWQLFLDWQAPQPGEIVLDLGGGDGAALSRLYPHPENIVLADIDKAKIDYGVKEYGLRGSLLLDESGNIPLKSKSVDIVFCNSVIEHVTVDKNQIWKVKSGSRFKELALKRQGKIASEIIRVGKKYWVQTPYRHFPFETHTWLLGTQYLPRPFQMETIRFLNRFWIKKTSPDFYLLSRSGARFLFPQSEIIFEKAFGLPKSLIIRTPKV